MWCMLTWHFSAVHTKPSGAQCTRVEECSCLCASTCFMCVSANECIHVNIWDTFAHSLFWLPPCPALTSQCMCSHSSIGRAERERELLWKVHLVSWQHPNYKVAETPHIERIILNYSEFKFKFHFVLALSNGQNCLGEISKGQWKLKCLL